MSRGRFPRFSAGNLEHNLELLSALERIAADRYDSPQMAALDSER